MNALEWKMKWILVTVLMAVIVVMAVCMYWMESSDKKEVESSVNTSFAVSLL